MKLGLSVYHTSGEFSPRVEYNAKSGRLLRVDRREGADGAFANDKIDITMTGPQFAFDIGSVLVGWAFFPPGAAPEVAMVPFGQEMPSRPGPKFKAGFKFRVWDGREAEARDLMSVAGVVVDAVEELWDRLMAAPEAARGDVPVLQFTNVVPIRTARGTNYAPVFQVVTWITRDERIFGPRTVAAPGSVVVPMVPTTAATPAAWHAPSAAPTAAAAPPVWQAGKAA